MHQSYQNHPVREFDHIQKIIKEVRRIRQQNKIPNNKEIQLYTTNEFLLTSIGETLLKKLSNVIIVKGNIPTNNIEIFFIAN